MKTFHLPYEITVELKDGGGTIRSALRNPYSITEEHIEWNTRIDMLESVILAHAVAGVEVESPAYMEGIETAVEAASND